MREGTISFPFQREYYVHFDLTTKQLKNMYFYRQAVLSWCKLNFLSLLYYIYYYIICTGTQTFTLFLCWGVKSVLILISTRASLTALYGRHLALMWPIRAQWAVLDNTRLDWFTQAGKLLRVCCNVVRHWQREVYHTWRVSPILPWLTKNTYVHNYYL